MGEGRGEVEGSIKVEAKSQMGERGGESKRSQRRGEGREWESQLAG